MDQGQKACGGRRYSVTVDGTKYDVVGESDSIGNASFTTCPVVLLQGPQGVALVGTKNPNETHTISVQKVGTAVVRLDEKYLPESVDGIVIRSSTTGSTKKFKVTVDDSGTISATETT